MACLLVLGSAVLAQTTELSGSAAPQAAPAAPENSANLLELLQQGGPLMYPLYACSILMVAFWIERIIKLRREKVIPPKIMDTILEAAAITDPVERLRLFEQIQSDASPMGRIINAGLRKARRPFLELEKAIEDAGIKEASRLQRNNKVFAIVSSIAPLLGLMGTVTGLMRCFMKMASSPEALGKMERMASGIYEALVTTIAGLTIAVPAMVLYFYYQERVDQLVRDIDTIVEEFLEKLFSRSVSGEL